MSYNFSTKPGQPAAFKLLVKANADSYTLTAEFTKSQIAIADWYTTDEAVILSVPVESNGNELTINLTAEQIDLIGRSYYRIKAVKAGQTLYIENGKVDVFHKAPVVEVVDGDLYVVEPGGGRIKAGHVAGPQGIQGLKGDKGDKGDTGPVGDQGPQGIKGDRGDTAYEQAVALGYVGTLSEWVASFPSTSYVDSKDKALSDRITVNETDLGGASYLATVGTANQLVRRSNNSYFDVLSPVAANHPVNKTYADALGSSAATVGTIMRRDTNGDSAVRNLITTAVTLANAPAGPQYATRKDYVDGVADTYRRPAVNNIVGATYTLATSDERKLLYFPNTATVTIPLTTSVPLPIGSVIDIQQGGVGSVTIALEAGVVLHNVSGLLTTAGLGHVIRLQKTFSNTWVLMHIGDSSSTATTSSTIVRRDASGGAGASQFYISSATPGGANHAARKDYVDNAVAGDANATAGTLVRRDGTGMFSVNTPTAPGHPASRDWVVNTVGDVQATANALARRDSTGFVRFNQVGATAPAPTQIEHLTRKDYVDALGTNAATPNTVARRDASGDTSYNQVGLAATAPVSPAQATRKDYVDSRGGWQVATAPATAGGAVPLAAFPFENTRLITLTSNMTLSGTPTAPAAGRAGVVRIILKQAAAGTGPFTVTWPASTTLPWSQGLPAPTMPTTADAEQIIELLYTGTRWVASLVWTD